MPCVLITQVSGLTLHFDFKLLEKRGYVLPGSYPLQVVPGTMPHTVCYENNYFAT